MKNILLLLLLIPVALCGQTYSSQPATGWESVLSDNYTSVSPLTTLSGDTTAIAFNGGVSIIRSYLPTGVDSFLNRTTNKFMPYGLGDGYDVRVNFIAENSLVNDGAGSIVMDIGGSQGIVGQEQILFTKGANTPQSFSASFSVFSLGTFLANGATFKIISDNGTIEIYNVNIFIKKDHHGG